MALLHPVYWPEVRRGSERFIHELGRELAARGHRPTLITSHVGPPRRSVEDGIEVVRLPRPLPARLGSRWHLEPHLSHLPGTALALRRARPDVIHALHPSDGWLAARSAARTGRPAVLSHMGIPRAGELDSARLRRRIHGNAARGASAVVALSGAAAAAVRRELGVDARVIPPAVDLETFTPGPGRAPEPVIVCAADVGEERKRVPLLTAAFARVRAAHPAARLVLSRPRVPAAAAELRGAPGVELRDLDDEHALADAYREAWVSALASEREAFGLVLAEAHACGTPGVGTDSGGIRELLDDPTVGRLFTGGEAGLARALLDTIELARDPATAARCRERAERFSPALLAERYLQLYSELVGAG